MKKTDWYLASIKPVRVGWYEVRLRTWPWPVMIKWTRRGWKHSIIHVKQWRGLKEKIK